MLEVLRTAAALSVTSTTRYCTTNLVDHLKNFLRFSSFIRSINKKRKSTGARAWGGGDCKGWMMFTSPVGTGSWNSHSTGLTW